MGLNDGILWSLPVNLYVKVEVADRVREGEKFALRDPEGIMLTVLHVKDKLKSNKYTEAEKVFGLSNDEHPSVKYLLNDTTTYYLGGKYRRDPVV